MTLEDVTPFVVLDWLDDGPAFHMPGCLVCGEARAPCDGLVCVSCRSGCHFAPDNKDSVWVKRRNAAEVIHEMPHGA